MMHLKQRIKPFLFTLIVVYGIMIIDWLSNGAYWESLQRAGFALPGTAQLISDTIHLKWWSIVLWFGLAGIVSQFYVRK